MKLLSAVKHWSVGIRFYIAIGIALFTLESWWWAATLYSGSLLFATRLEEIYAWAALTLLAIAVAIGPVCSTWPKIPGKRLLFEARRLFGIGAFWFSTLHVLITYASLFKFANPLTLPGTYQRAFAAGIVASLILLAMAFTSFDRAFRGMGRWWFRLHRFVYVAVLLSLLHAFLIGTHATHTLELVILAISVMFTLGLHIHLAFFRHKPATGWQLLTIPSLAIALTATLIFGYSQHLGYNSLTGRPDDSSPTMQSTDGMEMHQP